MQRHNAARVAKARAMVNVVGAEERAVHLLQEVVVLVGGLGAAVDGHGVRTVAPVDLHQAICRIVQRLVPRDFAPRVAFKGLRAAARLLRRLADQGCCNARRVIHEVVAEPPLDAEIALIDH